ncbi:MAG: metallophosphoesterase [Sedimentisphaeraceae bacterium JB056]
MSSNIRIAVITDIHFSAFQSGKRLGQYGDVFLLRIVNRLNRFIKPDIVIVLGDIIDNAEETDIGQRYKIIRNILDKLKCPYIVIPGNHDIAPDAFYDYFNAPELVTQCKGYGFVSFPYDIETPGYNAFRANDQIDLMAYSRTKFGGPLIVIQHVPVAPAEKAPCYNYVNSEQIINSMRDNGIFLSISGHYHPGYELYGYNSMNFVSVASLCEEPFNFWLLDIEDEKVSVDKHQLKIPGKYRLYDNHTHTQFAYCGENVSMSANLELADVFGLEGLCFSEHSGQLYQRQELWNKLDFFHYGLENCKDVRRQSVSDYINEACSVGMNKEFIALEVDIDANGELVLFDEDREKAGFLIGAVHYLKEASKKNVDYKEICNEFMHQTQKLLELEINILAHPFRVFRRNAMEPDQELFDKMVKMLSMYDTAVEINFHTNDPPLAFFRKCLDAGIKISLGSDAHNLYEIGEFYPHIELLKKAGCNGNFSNMLTPCSMR